MHVEANKNSDIDIKNEFTLYWTDRRYLGQSQCDVYYSKINILGLMKTVKFWSEVFLVKVKHLKLRSKAHYRYGNYMIGMYLLCHSLDFQEGTSIMDKALLF